MNLCHIYGKDTKMPHQSNKKENALKMRKCLIAAKYWRWRGFYKKLTKPLKVNHLFRKIVWIYG